MVIAEASNELQGPDGLQSAEQPAWVEVISEDSVLSEELSVLAALFKAFISIMAWSRFVFIVCNAVDNKTRNKHNLY